MNIDEIVKDCMLPHARNFCELIKFRDELGGSLRPSRMYAQGSACSPGQSFDFSEATMQARDRELALGLLGQLKGLRSDYPQLATEFGSVLAKAEIVWSGCIAA
jgi:hypothetical protein